jgi:ribosomal protein S27AE
LEDGLFVLCGKMVGLFKMNKWFYPVCHCGAFLNIASGSYYCGRCHVTVFSGTSKYELIFFRWNIYSPLLALLHPLKFTFYCCYRCKLQVGFQDLTSAALFPLLDSLIEEIECINNNVLVRQLVILYCAFYITFTSIVIC